MIVVVSPYHLTTREAPAMASLLLADQVVTLVPSPSGPGARAAKRAAAAAPAFRRFVESWEWATPLWNLGVIRGDFGGDDPAEEVREVAREIAEDAELTALRPLMREGVFDDERAYLQAVGADVTKGGPDPAITVPVAAALDRLATRHHALVARSPAVSVVQRAEEALATRLFAVGVPVLVQASAARLVHARDVLAEALAELRGAFGAVVADAYEGGRDSSAGADLQHAARAYAVAFDEAQAVVLEGSSEDDERAVVGSVAIHGTVLPADAVLRSSVQAAAQAAGVRTRLPGAASAAQLPAPTSGVVVSMVVRAMGAARTR